MSDRDLEHDDLEMDEDDEIEIDVSFELSEAVICCRVLYSLMVADDDFSVREQLFLKNTMDQLGLVDEEREAARALLSEAEAEAAVQTLPMEVRRALLDALFQVALVDGHMASAEMGYISRLRQLMGLS